MNTPTLNMMNGQGFLISIIFIYSKLLDSWKRSQYNKYLKKYPNQPNRRESLVTTNQNVCIFVPDDVLRPALCITTWFL